MFLDLSSRASYYVSMEKERRSKPSPKALCDWTTRLPPDLLRRVRDYAKREGLKLERCAAVAVEEYLAKRIA
jgi:hypothetical protein